MASEVEGMGNRMTRRERERTDPSHYFCLSCLQVHLPEDFVFERCKKWGMPYQDYVDYIEKHRIKEVTNGMVISSV